ncbi:hypothetical protein ACFSHP_09465 [Novosphingobium panipatense]
MRETHQLSMAAALMMTTSSAFAAPPVTPTEARAIAKQAYIYAYAPMESYQTWRGQAVDPNSPTYVGGFGKFRHYSEVYTPENKDIVTPNNDTPIPGHGSTCARSHGSSACRRCRKTATT